MRSLRLVSWVLAGSLAAALFGCGDGGSGSGGSAGQTTGPETGGGGSGGSGGTGGTGGTTMTTITFPDLMLTSPDLQEGGMFPATYTCAGDNTSPQLDWVAGPASTKGYAVIFEDVTKGLVHSAIWDIPADAVGLPANVEKTKDPANVPGARQCTAADNMTIGYFGPCPAGALHTYRFTVYAVDANPLPLVGIPIKESVAELALQHKVASGQLSAKSDAALPP